MLTAKLFARKKPNHRHCYAYDVEFDGELIIQNSRDPEHDLSRALLDRGLTGKATLLDGLTYKPRTAVNIENAAKWCAGSNLDRQRWKPSQGAIYSSPMAEDDLVVSTTPSALDAA